MIFAGADVGLPCFVGRYVNFSGISNRKNYITFGGTGSTCPLEQYQLFAQGRDLKGSSYIHMYYDGGSSVFSSFLALSNYNEQTQSRNTSQFFSDYFRVGVESGTGTFALFDTSISQSLFKTTYANDSGFVNTLIDGNDATFRHVLSYNGGIGGTIIRATEASIYSWVWRNGRENFTNSRADYGRIEAGINTNWAGLKNINSCYGLFGQLHDGNFGIFFTNYYNKLQWSVPPGQDWIEFFLNSNINRINKVGLYCNRSEASIRATSGSGAVTRNLYWDVGGAGIFHLWGSNGNYMKFYSYEASCFVSTIVGNYLKWNMNIGLLQLWGNNKYIDLSLYMLEWGMAATFHYVLVCDPKTGQIAYYKDQSGRHVKVLSTAPIIVQSCQSHNGLPGSPLCAIRYGV